MHCVVHICTKSLILSFVVWYNILYKIGATTLQSEPFKMVMISFFIYLQAVVAKNMVDFFILLFN